MKTMDKLLACPFCGGDEAGTKWHHGYWSVQCSYYAEDSLPYRCNQDWGEFDTEEEAVATWNRRPETENKPKTNADRIRSMTDGELAQILVSEPIAETIPFCQNKPECGRLLETASGIPESMCAVCALDWLQKPVEVVNSD